MLLADTVKDREILHVAGGKKKSVPSWFQGGDDGGV